MADRTRICMIGAGGHAGRNIYPCFYFLNDAEVVANADLDEGRARHAAARCGIPASYTDYREMLDKEKPDGVMVCISKNMHATLAMEIMERGIPVYTEKPNAPDFARCREVLEVARRTGVLHEIGYKKRFAPAYRKTRDIIDSEAFGEPALLTLVRTKGHGWGAGHDGAQEEYLLDWGCHAIDLLSYLFDPVKRLQVFTPRQTTHAWSVNLEFANGAVGHLCLTNRPGPLTEEVSAYGAAGVRVDVSNAINMVARKGTEVIGTNEPEWSCGTRNSAVEQGFLPELQTFVDAIREGSTPASNIETATHTMAVYDAILKSRAGDGALTDVEEL